VIRQVLKEVISVENNSCKRTEDIEKAKLSEIVGFLEKKIDRQHAEIKVISEQLSREISLKEEVLASLNE
jgi:chromosome segregation ATPase